MRLISFLFPLAIIFAVVFTFLWMFAVGKLGYALRGLFTGIPAILSCLFILFIYKKDVSLHDIDGLSITKYKVSHVFIWDFLYRFRGCAPSVSGKQTAVLFRLYFGALPVGILADFL